MTQETKDQIEREKCNSWADVARIQGEKRRRRRQEWNASVGSPAVVFEGQGFFSQANGGVLVAPESIRGDYDPTSAREYSPKFIAALVEASSKEADVEKQQEDV